MRRLILAAVVLLCATQAHAQTFRNFTVSGFSGSAMSSTTNKPTGVVSGDLLIFTVALFGTTITPTTITFPAGFTQFTTVANTGTGGSEVELTAAWKIAGGSEASTYAASWTNNFGVESMMIAYSGTHQTSPIQVTAVTQAETGSSTTITAPSITATGSGVLLCIYGKSGAGTFSSFGTLTNRTTTTDVPFGADLAVSAGATGTKAITISASLAGRTEISIIIAPPPSNGLLLMGVG